MSRAFRASRRRVLQGAMAAGAITAAEWLGFFRENGVPGTSKDWGIATARAAEENTDSFLVYWYCEGGWDSYSMLSPVHTPNHSGLSVPANTLNPTPAWSDQRYRVAGYGSGNYGAPSTVSGIPHGYLAVGGRALFPEMCVVPFLGGTFHSGSRLDLHYGTYQKALSAQRGPDEMTVMQAFAAEKGGSFLVPHVSWHNWLSDGELDPSAYPEGTGYSNTGGPPHAHTVYAKTPAQMRARLSANANLSTAGRRASIRSYTDNMRDRFLRDRDGASVAAFGSALAQYRALSTAAPIANVENMFQDPALRAHFGVTALDELSSAHSSVDPNARSKESPQIWTQAMMAYELMRAKVSCALFLETQEARGFDLHRGRSLVMDSHTNSDQLAMCQREIWTPLAAFVAKLKDTEMPGLPGSGVSMYDRTTIVLCSEMGRTIHGNVDAILADNTKTDAEKYQAIREQDVCQHWHVGAAAFLGGSVVARGVGARSFCRVGSESLDHIPLMPDGSLDPAYNATTGRLNSGQSKSPTSFVPDHGSLYATALQLAGVNPSGKGRNTRGALAFVSG